MCRVSRRRCSRCLFLHLHKGGTAGHLHMADVGLTLDHHADTGGSRASSGRGGPQQHRALSLVSGTRLIPVPNAPAPPRHAPAPDPERSPPAAARCCPRRGTLPLAGATLPPSIRTVPPASDPRTLPSRRLRYPRRLAVDPDPDRSPSPPTRCRSRSGPFPPALDALPSPVRRVRTAFPIQWPGFVEQSLRATRPTRRTSTYMPPRFSSPPKIIPRHLC